MRIFVYECVCGGGLGMGVPASLLREGYAMLAAVVEDLQRIAGVHVVTLIDRRLAYEPGDECRLTVSDSVPFGTGVFEPEEFEEIAAECDATLAIAPEFLDLLYDLSRLAPKDRWLGSSSAAI